MIFFAGRSSTCGCPALALFALMSLSVSAQTAESSRLRMVAVEDHLSHYVVIRGAKNAEMRLRSQMAALKVPAVSIAAIRKGEIDWARAYGVSSIDGALATTKTLFGAASISKPVTALGVLKLAEAGKIDLDADVNGYLKRWKIPENEFTAKEKVTVRELLNHTSGIGTHNGEIYDQREPLPTLLELLDGRKPAKTVPVRVEAVPGTQFAYSNGGYLVLELLVEDVTGRSFAGYMKWTVLDAIGMRDSTFDSPLQAEWQSRAATAYEGDGRTAHPPGKFVEPNLAGGGLWSTPTDLAKFLIEVQREYDGKSHKVLHQKTARMMLEPNKKLASKRSWALGFEVGGGELDPYIRHEGSAFFQDDMVEYLRGKGAGGDGVVVMTSGGNGGVLTEEVIRSAAGVYDFPDFRPVEHSVVEVAVSELARFAGSYGFIKAAFEGDHLTAEIPSGSSPVRLYAESPTHFFVLDGPQELSFLVDADGKVTGVEFITPMGRHALEKNAAK